MRPFVASDLAEINSWYAARGIGPLALQHLPAHGQIEPGVAAGFLYLTDSSLALLEGYVTSPSAGLRERNRAINSITVALFDEAKRRGVSQVLAICAARGIERRARTFGMRTIGTYAMCSRSM